MPLMTRLAATYSPNYFKDDYEGKIRADDLWEDLGHLDPADLAVGCKEVRKVWGLKGEFGMPTPALILQCANIAKKVRLGKTTVKALPEREMSPEELREGWAKVRAVISKLEKQNDKMFEKAGLLKKQAS